MQKLLNNEGIKVSLITVLINFLLFLFKLIMGLIAHSKAMVSDAIHSLSDVISTFVVIIGLIFSANAPDKEHPYGHERIESVIAIILAFFLFLTGMGIGILGIKDVLLSSSLKIPGTLALVAALVSILVKEGMFQYTKRVAKKLASVSMMADAYHHRSDALSSIGSFIGIFLSRLGLVVFDPLCSIVICILIVKSSIEIFMDATKGMIDKSCDDKVKNQIITMIMNTDNNLVINDLKTRMFASKIYVDAELALDGSLTLNESNNIVNNIHDVVEKELPIIKHLNIRTIPKSEK